MRIGGVGMTPYIYNTNMVSSLSMNRISAIPDDATARQVDYTGLLSDELENINPLKKGQSSNFMDILMSQMSMSQYHQAKVMPDILPVAPEESEIAVEDMADEMQNMMKPQETEEVSAQQSDMSQNEQAFSSYRMNQALQAYNMSMGFAF